MKNNRLEAGTLVYNKHHGRGIITKNLYNRRYQIIFEGRNNQLPICREDLFVREDKVSSKLRDIHFIYEGYCPFLKEPFAVRDSSGLLCYLDDIYHIEDTIEITVKVNGREVPLNALVMDTLEKIRAMETP